MFKMSKVSIFLLLLSLGACSSGQSTFYWYKPETGISYFAKEHNACLYHSDSWPYEFPSYAIPPNPEMYDLRLRSEDDSGIWAFYIALPGSQPVYVNSKVQGQWSMDADDYSECMRERGYVDMYTPVVDRKIGLKKCTQVSCVDAWDYQSAIEERKARDEARAEAMEEARENGYYNQTYNNMYYGEENGVKPHQGAYTSHYLGQDSERFY